VRDPKSICDTIHRTFGDIPYPGDDDIVPRDMKNDRSSQEVRRAFRGKPWQSLTKEEVYRHCDDLVFMTPEAYHFFLPGFMVHCLLTPLEVNTACSSIVYELAPPEQIEDQEWWRQRVSLFNRMQGEAIVEFLIYEEERLREDWAKMRTPIETTDATAALSWWREHLASSDEQS
jgi:hypothetical protein